MLRAVIASLLVGAGVLTLGLYMAYRQDVSGYGPAPPWAWDGTTARAFVGSGSSVPGGWQLILDSAGHGLMVLPLPSLRAGSYPILRLRFADEAAVDSLSVAWRTAEGGELIAQYRIPGKLEHSLWLPMSGLGDWRGNLVELALMVEGGAGQRVVLEAAGLVPASPLNQLRALYFDWQALVPWAHYSINHYNPRRSQGATLYMVPVITALLAASLLAYGAMLLCRSDMRFDWRVVAALFLLGWIFLDLGWQAKLWRQLELTREQFAGLDSPARLAVGPDAALVAFMSDVRQRLTAADARVFVASADDYTGMRGSYYLYPLNVFWQRMGPELPAARYLQPGDYIVLVNPSKLRFDADNSTLQAPGEARIPVEMITSGGLGSLYRVM